MSLLLGMLLFISAIAFAVSMLLCTIFYFVEEQWPIWHFRLFFAWWWPFRKSSAATMLADTMIGAMYKDWREDGYKTWRNSKLQASVREFCDAIKAELGGDKIPLNQWDKYVLARAIKRFTKGNVGDLKEQTTLKAAEAIIKTYGSAK